MSSTTNKSAQNPPNNDLREVLLKIFGARLISAQWETPPEEVVDEILEYITIYVAQDRQRLLDKLLAELDGLKREKSGWEDSANDPKKLIRLTHNEALDQCRKIIEGYTNQSS